MPDRRLARARATLPSGYQFGDARVYAFEAWPRDGNELTIWLYRWFSRYHRLVS